MRRERVGRIAAGAEPCGAAVASEPVERFGGGVETRDLFLLAAWMRGGYAPCRADLDRVLIECDHRHTRCWLLLRLGTGCHHPPLAGGSQSSSPSLPRTRPVFGLTRCSWPQAWQVIASNASSSDLVGSSAIQPWTRRRVCGQRKRKVGMSVR
jgi:hypothetical protein